MAVLIGAFFLGWGLGVNDGANVFAPATGAGVVSRRMAGVLAAGFVFFGAVILGERGVHTLVTLAGSASPGAAAGIALSAAAAVWLMAFLGLPSSVTQAVVGAVLGVQLGLGGWNGFPGLWRILGGWVLSPVLGAGAAWALDRAFQALVRRRRPSVFQLDSWVRLVLIPVSCYSAWSLGANNAANVAAMPVVAATLSPHWAVVLAGMFMALGALRPSRRVAGTVGADIVRLDSTAACTAVASQALAMNVFAWVGVPVSATQTMVGAVIGVGFSRGLQTVRWKRVVQVFGGWFFAPATAAAFGFMTAVWIRAMLSAPY